MSKAKLKLYHYRVAGLTAAALLVAITIGCSKSDTPKEVQSDTVPSPDPSTAVASDSGVDSLPGNSSKVLAYLEELRPHWTTEPKTVTLNCHQGHDTTTTTQVNVAIFTHQLSYKIDAVKILDRTNPETAQSPKGRIVLKFVNLDPVECGGIGLRARDSVYLWAGKTNKKRAFALFRIDGQGNAEGVARALSGLHCRLQQGPTASDVHLRQPPICEPDAVSKLDLYRDSGVPNAKPLHNQGVWYACPGGCCQASNFGDYGS